MSVRSLADPTKPVIALPNIGSGNRSVDVALILKATCGILDTIQVNNALEVRDEVELNFTGVGRARTERYRVDPYLGAIGYPVFSISTQLSSSPVRAGDLVTRTVQVSNGSVTGYTDTLVYEVAQGPGASIQEVFINGASKAFAKTVNPSGDTLIRLVLSGTDFAGNLQGSGPGNGDARFDPNERLVVTETVYVRNCRELRVAHHYARFGCDGEFCATTSLQSDLPIGSGQPSLRFSKAAPFPNTEVGYCQLGEMELWVKNLGRESDPTSGRRAISRSARSRTSAANSRPTTTVLPPSRSRGSA